MKKQDLAPLAYEGRFAAVSSGAIVRSLPRMERRLTCASVISTHKIAMIKTETVF